MKHLVLIMGVVASLFAENSATPERPLDSGLSYYVGGSFIYWQAIEKNLEVAELIISSAANPRLYKELNTDFVYVPGFQIHLGLDKDELSTYFEYTRLHRSDNKTYVTPADAEGLSSYWTFPGEFSSIQHNWILDYDILSWTIQNQLSPKKSWLFIPYFGLKGGTLSQKIVQSAIPLGETFSVDAFFRSKSWLLGPGAGFQNQIRLGRGFSFFLSADFYLLYQDFRVLARNESNTNPSLVTTDRHDINYITQNADVSFAFSWESPLWRDRYSMELAAGYDFLYFTGQNGMKAIRAILYGADTGSLMFQGFNISAAFYW